MALGGLGLKLSDLAALYAGLARGGEPVALYASARATEPKAPAAAAAAVAGCSLVRHGHPAPCARPANAKPGQIAYKTGTSYGFRDAWAVGYDGRHTIAVWVGPAGWRRNAGLGRARGRSADPVRCVRPPEHPPRAACRRRRPARC
jgi:penicillin-binding protein 1C